MSVLEQIRTAILRPLTEAGIPTAAAYSRDWAAQYGSPVLVVGFGSGGSCQLGFCDYLGQSYDPDTATYQERYGKQLELTLTLDAYSPRTAGAGGCELLLEQVQEALSVRPLTGLRLGDMTWEEVAWDRDADMFHRRAILPCTAAFIATIQEETGVLLDFRLKGELRD